MPNKQGETPIDLSDDWPEARRVLRQDPRVPQDYATMTAAMRIQDLTSRSPITVLRLLKEAPQALTDVHQREVDRPASILSNGSKPDRSEALRGSAGETGIDILVRLKNYNVLATLANSTAHWPMLRQEFGKLIGVAEIPAAVALRAALRDRYVKGEITPGEASDLFSAYIDADDFESAQSLVDLGEPPKLRADREGFTVLHREAVLGDTDHFRRVLEMCRLAPQPDAWGRLPVDLAPETKLESFRQIEAATGVPVADASLACVRPAAIASPPYLCLERDEEARPADDDLMAALRDTWEAKWGDIADFDVRIFDLPFHPTCPLVEARPNASTSKSGRFCFLLKGDRLYRLDGASLPIHQVNELEQPRINAQTVLSYLAFFCFFVRGEDGAFLNIDRRQGVFLPDLGDRAADIFRSPQIWGQDEECRWRVSSLIFYGEAVFFANFLVYPTGMIEMLNDTPVTPDLAMRIDAPLELRTLQ